MTVFVWFVFSRNDWNFGTFVLSRSMHDQFLGVYANLLGVEISELPSMLLKGLMFDGLLVGSFIAFRKRKVLVPWMREQFVPTVRRFAVQES